jgi:hypothetical protein
MARKLEFRIQSAQACATIGSSREKVRSSRKLEVDRMTWRAPTVCGIPSVD